MTGGEGLCPPPPPILGQAAFRHLPAYCCRLSATESSLRGLAAKVGRVLPHVCHKANISVWTSCFEADLLVFSPAYPRELALQGSFGMHKLDSFWLVLTWRRCCRSGLAVP